MARILAGEADAIIVWKVSRFSRNWREAAEDVELLLDNKKDLLSEEGFDTDSNGGRLLLRILFVLANWEHEVLGEHWEVIKTKAVQLPGSAHRTQRTGHREEPRELEGKVAVTRLELGFGESRCCRSRGRSPEDDPAASALPNRSRGTKARAVRRRESSGLPS